MRKKGWSLDGTRSENVVTWVKRYILGKTFFLDQKNSSDIECSNFSSKILL